MPVAELTLEQRAAIATRDVSIALSAGAGCGKTFVLTQRFLDHLQPRQGDDEPARLHQLIAITFTDAAAREMRSRIRSECYKQLTHSQSIEDQNHWQRLMREIDAARVSTIHTFCASLLRTHAAAAGLDPLFGVLDQIDADVLQLDVIDDVLREQLGNLDEETLNLAAAYGLARLKQQISAIIRHRHDESFDRWLKATPDEMISCWRTWYEEKAFPLAVREIAAAESIAALLDQLRDVVPNPAKPKFCDARCILLELLPRLQKHDVSHDEVQLIRESAKVAGICTTKDWGSAESFSHYRDTCKALRDAIDEYLPKPFDPDAARRAAELGLALLRLTKKVADNYEQRKHELGKLDFDDLLFATHALVSDPKNAALRKQLSSELRLLLVDEFQDTDALQARLVRALCGEGFDVGRLFFVGDYKQSIYRFRGAQPSVFRDLRAGVHERGRLPLTLNFRSQPGILDFVNSLFCDVLRIEDEDYQPLRASRAQTTSPPCVEFLWTITPEKNNHRIAGSSDDARRQEARTIARRLRGLIDGKENAMPVVDGTTYEPRPLQLGDVAILFRTLNDVQVYEEALREYDLDYYLVGGHAFYAQQEIYDVLNLLRAVASSADEVSLAGVLRSPFFALADESLFWLVDSAGTLNAGLSNQPLPSQLLPEEHAKAAAAADTIRHLRAIKDRVPIATLLKTALHRTGYDAALLAEFLGQRKLANLHKLLERARAADRSGVTGLDGFITQLAQFIARQPKEALAATLPEAANVIRLMTIHHAKGLEFPLVVLPDLDRPPRVFPPPAALHPEFGPLVPPPGDDEDHKKLATGMSLYTALEKGEELEERNRLLYVACTRAADYLILSSSLEAYDKPKSDWMQMLGERFNLETGESLAELPESYTAPQIHVENGLTTDRKPAARSRGADLLKLLNQARELAENGHAIAPPGVAPIPVDNTARRRFSFTQLGRLVRNDDESLPRARLLGTRRGEASSPPSEIFPTVHAQSLGALAHKVLARTDLNNAATIAEWCEHLAPQLVLLNAENAARTTSELIYRFAASARGKQIATASALHREVEFILAWSPDRPTATDATYLHGFIDCLYQDNNGQWHITDYKTDNIQAADVAEYAKRYAMQLYVYAMAAERALGESPTELALYFLRPGIEHVFPWNDAARRDAIEMVNAAIEAARVPPASFEDEQSQTANLENTSAFFI